MPNVYLFIVGLVFFTFLFPENISFLLNTIRKWFQLRQARREEIQTRQDVVDDAMDDFVTRVAVTVKQLRVHPNKTQQKQVMMQLKAQAERYLLTINHDEQPPLHRFAQEIVHDIEQEMQK